MIGKCSDCGRHAWRQLKGPELYQAKREAVKDADLMRAWSYLEAYGGGRVFVCVCGAYGFQAGSPMAGAF